ncbi:MAG TPA: DUF3795 domain-containing protein [Dehalococcoidia bacterium]|nr:DUF3795 domain-containing protein [Dehalococcoidia bacterium]
MIAFCGTVCTECPAFLATKKDDDIERKRIAELWSKRYNADIKPEDINCVGCLSEGEKLFSYCNVCEIRKCGQEKGLKNCAYCDEYVCEKLSEFFKIAPGGKTTLDEIKKGL